VDATVDATVGAAVDATVDATVDAAPDADVDAASDAPIDAPADAVPDAPVDAPVDAAPDATVDAPVDADVTSPVVTDVETSDGFTEVRQFSTVTLVITGDRLAAATSVIVGAIVAPIVTRTDTQLTVTLTVPHGHAAGPLGVTVTTPDGVVTAPAAITITHFIVAPTAPPGGRGTYDSPITLCDPASTAATAGDTLELLAGTHTCPDRLSLVAGFRMIGAGTALTIVDTVGWDLFTTTGPSEIAHLTWRGASIEVGYADRPFSVHDLVAESAPLSCFDVCEVRFERVTATGSLFDGSGYATVSATDVDITARPTSFTALRIDEGSIGLTRTTVRGFQVAIAVNADPQGSDCQASVRLADSTIIDAVTGIAAGCDGVYLARSRIIDDPATATVARNGIALENGTIVVSDQSRIEVAETAIRGGGRGCAGFHEYNSQVNVSDAVIIGGTAGINQQSCDGGGMTLRSSTVRGGTFGVRGQCFDGHVCRYELTGNDLQVTSPTGHAWIDVRSSVGEFDPPTDATGTTFNGRSYAGQLITGPAQVTPDYWIQSNDVVQF
jgi:hypothetical protein